MLPEVSVIGIDRLNSANKKASLVFDIKRNSLDDGPGIRSVVFFKGCPLSCTWCQNPESIETGLELLFDAEKCIGCNDCISACPENAIDKSRDNPIDRSICTLCLSCVAACPSGALEPVGKSLPVERLLEQLLQDAAFYKVSGGGVTLSGGEPLMQMATVSSLLQRLKQHGIHTLIETSGFFNFRTFEKTVLPHTDAVYMDIKLIDSQAHSRYCGVPNEVILQNFADLQALACQGEVELLPRVPLIPEVTATEENLTGIADFVVNCKAEKIQLLPYNPLFLDKLPKLGTASRLDLGDRSRKFIPADELDVMKRIFSSRGLQVICH